MKEKRREEKRAMPMIQRRTDIGKANAVNFVEVAFAAYEVEGAVRPQ
jgi:hypothetical protein